MERDSLRQLVTEAEEDDQSRALRAVLCRTLAKVFRETGQALWVAGYLIGRDRPEGRSPFGFGSDATVGLATVVQIAGELTSGAVLALEHGNVYSASALLRQLVEVEYLAWAFAEDQEEAERWLRSSPAERLRMWQPRHVRKRAQGRFRGVDYHLHCEHGGHPTPKALMMLPGHNVVMTADQRWYEVAAHGTSVWTYFLAAAKLHAWGEHVPEAKDVKAVSRAVRRWRTQDKMVQAGEEIGTAMAQDRRGSAAFPTDRQTGSPSSQKGSAPS